jgi:flagellar motor switch protein FliM
MISTTSFSGKRKEGVPGAEAALSKRLAPADVDVEVRLAPDRIPLGEVAAWRPGDIVVTSHAAAAPLTVLVEGQPKFLARLGRLKDRKAMKILQAAPVKEPSLVPGIRTRAEVMKADPPGEAPEGYEANLLGMPVKASAILARKPVKVKQVLALRPGDLVEFPHAAERPLLLRVANRELAEGVCVRRGEHFGLRISGVLPPR